MFRYEIPDKRLILMFKGDIPKIPITVKRNRGWQRQAEGGGLRSCVVSGGEWKGRRKIKGPSEAKENHVAPQCSY